MHGIIPILFARSVIALWGVIEDDHSSAIDLPIETNKQTSKQTDYMDYEVDFYPVVSPSQHPSRVSLDVIPMKT